MRFIPNSDDFIPASHEDPSNPGVVKRVIATRDELLEGRVQMLNWAKLPVGSSFRKHYHEDMEETFIIVSGRAQMVVAGETVDLVAGDTIIVSPREVHSMTNIGELPVEYLVFGVTTDEGGKTVVVE